MKQRHLTIVLATLGLLAGMITLLVVNRPTSGSASGQTAALATRQQPLSQVVPHGTPNQPVTVAADSHALATPRQPLSQVVPHGTNQPVKVAADSDGCNHGYGTAGQCVPLRAAGNRAVTCAYLKAEGFFRQPLLIKRDNLHLLSHHAVLSISGHDSFLTSCS